MKWYRCPEVTPEHESLEPLGLLVEQFQNPQLTMEVQKTTRARGLG